MSRTVNDLLNIAIGQLGYMEKESCSNLDNNTANAGDNNHTKYARDLHKAGYYQSDKCGYAWCDVFVDWCFYILCNKNATLAQKMTYQSGPYGAGCKYSANYYKNAGRLFTSDPKPGDQIFFGNPINHTGVVEKVTSTIITTIEGNTGNKVARRTYRRTNKYINCFGRPLYEEDIKVDTDSSVKNDNITIDVSATKCTNYTVEKGDCWWDLAKEYMGSGVKMHELAKLNNTTINKVLRVGDIIKVPVKSSNTAQNNNSINNTTDNRVYTVLKGDSWWSIAAKTLGSGAKMVTLAKYNNKSITTMLHPGDVLKIPNTKSNSSDTSYETYTVKKGDSWWGIAKNEMGSGLKMNTLAKYNNKTIATILHPGDVLKIPK